MGFDATVKRYFPLVVCALIAVAAYFQASGMGQLVAAAVSAGAPSASATPSHRAPPPVVLPQPTDHATDAAPVIERNPFDSVTGPLIATAIPTVDAPPVPTTPPNTDPMLDPACDACKVLLITQSNEDAWSFAALSGSDGKSVLRRRGDTFNNFTIQHIGWDRVWMTQGATRCQARMFGSETPATPTASPMMQPPPVPEPTPSSRPSKGVPPEIASKIHKISETEFSIERSVVDQILENQAELMRSARIVPEKEGDKVTGIRLFGIKPTGLLGTLGLKNGDKLQSINGFEMSDPQKALEAYARLRTADHLTVSVVRAGKPVNIDYGIK